MNGEKDAEISRTPDDVEGGEREDDPDLFRLGHDEPQCSIGSRGQPPASCDDYRRDHRGICPSYGLDVSIGVKKNSRYGRRERDSVEGELFSLVAFFSSR